MKNITKNITKTFILLLAACIFALGGFFFATKAEAQRTGPYQLVAHSNDTANVGIFRIDTASGRVSFCFLEGNVGNVSTRCTAEAN